MPRKSEVKFPEEDQFFLDAQADALGCDAQTYLRMVVRQMRLGQLPTLGFGGGARTKPTSAERLLDADLRARRQPELPRPEFPVDPTQWGQPAPLPEQNEPADDFQFPRGELPMQAEPIAQAAEPRSAVPSLVDDMARIATEKGNGSVSSLRRSLRSTTVAPQLSGPPGSATRLVGVNQQLARDEQGDGRGNVQRQNMKHFFGR